MIRIIGLFPDEPGKRFDWDYYLNKHMPMVHRLTEPLGLVRTEVDRGSESLQPGTKSPYVAVAYLYYNSLEDFRNTIATHGPELVGDIPNFTDIKPQLQISEIVE